MAVVWLKMPQQRRARMACVRRSSVSPTQTHARSIPLIPFDASSSSRRLFIQLQSTWGRRAKVSRSSLRRSSTACYLQRGMSSSQDQPSSVLPQQLRVFHCAILPFRFNRSTNQGNSSLRRPLWNAVKSPRRKNKTPP